MAARKWWRISRCRCRASHPRFSCRCLVIDDPIRSREDAASDIIRRNTWEWFSADLKTRLKPGGRIILILTRWHRGRHCRPRARRNGQGRRRSGNAHPAGDCGRGRSARTQGGEFLWDADRTYGYGDFLRRELATQPPANWAALYQQRSAPKSGNFSSRNGSSRMTRRRHRKPCGPTPQATTPSRRRAAITPCI